MKRLALCVLGAGLLLTPALNATWISISPAALRPADSLASTVVWHATPSEFYFETYAPYIVQVPLQLPDEAVLKQFVVYVTDQGGVGNNIWVQLQKQDLATGAVTEVVTLTTMDLGMITRRMISRAFLGKAIKIDNNRYSYSLRINFDYAGSNMKFHGAKIRY
jgi:hypothetical protein